MSQKTGHYLEDKENLLITFLSALIILCLLGSCSLMIKGKEDCHSMNYTYCGEKADPHKH